VLAGGVGGGLVLAGDADGGVVPRDADRGSNEAEQVASGFASYAAPGRRRLCFARRRRLDPMVVGSTSIYFDGSHRLRDGGEIPSIERMERHL
jgi:hypothetical protein